MKLIGLTPLQQHHFTPHSAPDQRTLREWIECGILPGVRRGKRYFVDHAALTHRLGNDFKLMSVPEYINERFVVGSRPDVRTVRQWVDHDDIPGIRLGKLYFINITSECWATGNPLMDKALAA